MFPLPRPTTRRDLRSAGVSRFPARPLRYTGPHHSRRGHPLPSFYIGPSTRVLPLRSIPQELLARRLPGYLLAVAWLDAVLDPGVAVSHSSISRSPHGLRPVRGDRPFPKLMYSRGFVSDSGLHPSPRHARYFSFHPFGLSRFATGRLTRPYPERLSCPAAWSSSTRNHCQVARTPTRTPKSLPIHAQNISYEIILTLRPANCRPKPPEYTTSRGPPHPIAPTDSAEEA